MLDGLDPDRIVERWRHEAIRLAGGADIPCPARTPQAEIRRSPAAAAVGRLAAQQGLSCFHFEHRVHLPLPAAWVDPMDPTLADPPEWDGGILPERKYQSFRHDLPLGSFHPHHRAKWSTHELCHGLVGFAWRADATPFFTATAGRLAELLPVVLWYTFDEAFLTRCPEHQGSGALFRTFCRDCERVAVARADDPDARHHVAQGLRYLDRELAAIARSRRLGRPCSHRWATLDLASDGVAYARAHHTRLSSPTFARFAERFCIPGGGMADTLDALEARVLDVAAGILGESEPAPLAPDASLGAARWALQDLGWRLLQVAADCDGLAQSALHDLVDTLAAHIPATTRPGNVDLPAITQAAASSYRSLAEGWSLPPIGDVFAVGYPMAGADPSPQMVDGLRSACPLLGEGMETGLEDLAAQFIAQEVPTRAPLASRWRDWVADRGLLADLATWEAAVAELPRTSPLPLEGPPASPMWVLAPGFTALQFNHDVLRLAERIDAGEITLHADGSVSVHGDEPVETEPQALLLGRDAAGEVLLLGLDPETAALLASGPFHEDGLDDAEHDALFDVGAICPQSLALEA